MGVEEIENILRDRTVQLKFSSALVGLLDGGVRPDGLDVGCQLRGEWHVGNVGF